MGGWFSSQTHACVFCDILSSLNDGPANDIALQPMSDKILKFNENLAVLKDKRPAATHHYLVVPRSHISNPKTLHNLQHAKLIEDMHQFGKSYIEENVQVDPSKEVRYGFHWPPLISVDHLHMHIIYPCSECNFLNSQLFKHNSSFFLSPERLINIIKLKS